MNRFFFVGPLAVFLFVMVSCPTGYGAEIRQATDEKVQGGVDWARGLIRGKGLKAPTAKTPGKPIDRAEALALAKNHATANLMAILKSIRIDSAHTVGQLCANDPAILVRITEMAGDAPVVKQDYLSDGTVEVTLEMPMSGGFSQLVLPEEIKQIESIQTVSPAETSSDAGAGNGNSRAISRPIAHTGLIVDARGLDLNPTLYPKIYDESGQEIYGSAFASREFAVQQGMARYVKDIAAAADDPRVARNPLIVKGLRTTRPAHADIVVSNADASKVRSSSEHLSFLKKCRVLIVVE